MAMKIYTVTELMIGYDTSDVAWNKAFRTFENAAAQIERERKDFCEENEMDYCSIEWTKHMDNYDNVWWIAKDFDGGREYRITECELQG